MPVRFPVEEAPTAVSQTDGSADTELASRKEMLNKFIRSSRSKWCFGLI